MERNEFLINWESTYAENLSTAMIGNRPILLVFSESDWCMPWEGTGYQKMPAQAYVPLLNSFIK